MKSPLLPGIAVLCFAIPCAHGTSPAWIRQLGTSETEQCYGASADGAGNVFIAGNTEGSVGGPNAGFRDAFVSKYGGDGSLQWTRQFGTNSPDEAFGVSSDENGNVYVSGSTLGNLVGPNAGSDDAFLIKLDGFGNYLWGEQFGTGLSDVSQAVSTDPMGNVYVSGHTRGNLDGLNAGSRDAFVSKFSSSGILLWTRQFGTSGHDECFGVSADQSGNVYVGGLTTGELGSTPGGSNDAFLTKLNDEGAIQWTRQLGTAGVESSYDIAADSTGNVFITGYTNGDLTGPSTGGDDAFLSRFDQAGDLLWTQQFGTSADDVGRSVAVDGLGNAYVSGFTEGDLGGANAGYRDAFIAMFNVAGVMVWKWQFGTPELDDGYGVSVDGTGNIFAAGWTDGILGGPSAGGSDAYVIKFSNPIVPEPTTVWLAATAFGAAWSLTRTRR